MIFTLIAVIIGVWAFLKYKDTGSANWPGLLLAVFLLFMDLHFYLLSMDLARFSDIGGTPDSGLIFSRFDNATNMTMTYTYLAQNDTRRGEYIGYKNAEEAIMGNIFGPILWALIICAVSYISWDAIRRVLVDSGLIPK